MNWSRNEINLRDNLQWFELQVSHSNFNKYNLFVLHTSKQYNNLEAAGRAIVIKMVGLADEEDPASIDDLNYNKSIVFSSVYNNLLSAEEKAAWGRRANFLNNQPKPGMFLTLPTQLHSESFNRRMLQLECHEFGTLMKRALVSKQMREVAMQQFKIPNENDVETQALRQVHVANTLLALLLGPTFRENCSEEEIILGSSKYPVYLHICCADRIQNVFQLSDLQFACYFDLKTELTYSFCSSCSLGFFDRSATFTAYGMHKEGDFIVWKYMDSDTEASLVSIRKPVFKTDKSGYDVTSCTTSVFRMVDYYPVSIYVSNKNYRNFVFLSPRVCIDRDGLIVDEFSS